MPLLLWSFWPLKDLPFKNYEHIKKIIFFWNYYCNSDFFRLLDCLALISVSCCSSVKIESSGEAGRMYSDYMVTVRHPKGLLMFFHSGPKTEKSTGDLSTRWIMAASGWQWRRSWGTAFQAGSSPSVSLGTLAAPAGSCLVHSSF